MCKCIEIDQHPHATVDREQEDRVMLDDVTQPYTNVKSAVVSLQAGDMKTCSQLLSLKIAIQCLPLLLFNLIYCNHEGLLLRMCDTMAEDKKKL